MQIVGLTNGHPGSEFVACVECIPTTSAVLTLSPDQIIWGRKGIDKARQEFSDRQLIVERERGIGDFDSQEIKWFEVT